MAWEAAHGRRALDPEFARLFWKCTDCGAAQAVCRHRIDPAPSLRAARTQAIEAGQAPREVDWLRERFARHGSPYSVDLNARLAGAATGPPAIPPRDVAFVPSCSALAHDPAQVQSAVWLLRQAGRHEVRTTLPDPPCCGYPLLAAGLESEFRAHARRVVDSLRGFETVVTDGPSCAHTLAFQYPAAGVTPGFQTLPLVDLLAAHTSTWQQLAAKRAPSAERLPPLAYHDSCFLGRRLQRWDEPRAALSAATGAAPHELPLAREQAPCSGGGGVYPLTHPEPARACAQSVLEAFRFTRAGALVTGCPGARRRLLEAEPDAPVLGLTEALARACGKDDAAD